jgi:hypothetical protein
MRRRVALPICQGRASRLRSAGACVECRDEADRDVLRAALRFELLCLLGNGTNLLKWKARALRTAFRP